MNRYRCDACGQITDMERAGIMHAGPTRFCPFCGQPALAPVKSAFTSFDAPCFAGIARPLLMALYQLWRKDHAGYVSFLAFAAAVANGTLVLSQESPDHDASTI